MILSKNDATRMGCIYPVRSMSATDVAAATKPFLSDVGGGVECFRTDNGTKFVNNIFERLSNGKKSTMTTRGWTAEARRRGRS